MELFTGLAPTSVQLSLPGSIALLKRNILLIIITPFQFSSGNCSSYFSTERRGLGGKLELAMVQVPNGRG